MHRYARMGLILALLPVAACSSMNGQTATTMTVPPPAPAPKLAAGDMQFVTQAANAGEAEVELGKLAQTKAERKGVRDFAGRMVTDHSAVNQQLAALASQEGVTVSPTVDPTDAALMQKLQGESRRMFDADYIHGQVAAHQEAIALFQQEATDGTDPDLKAFAAKTLPTLKRHLQMAETEARMLRRRG